MPCQPAETRLVKCRGPVAAHVVGLTQCAERRAALVPPREQKRIGIGPDVVPEVAPLCVPRRSATEAPRALGASWAGRPKDSSDPWRLASPQWFPGCAARFVRGRRLPGAEPSTRRTATAPGDDVRRHGVPRVHGCPKALNFSGRQLVVWARRRQRFRPPGSREERLAKARREQRWGRPTAVADAVLAVAGWTLASLSFAGRHPAHGIGPALSGTSGVLSATAWWVRYRASRRLVAEESGPREA